MLFSILIGQILKFVINFMAILQYALYCYMWMTVNIFNFEVECIS